MLLRRNDAGDGVEDVSVHRLQVHNILELDEHAFHVIPEAFKASDVTTEGENLIDTIDVCGACRSRWSLAAVRVPAPPVPPTPTASGGAVDGELLDDFCGDVGDTFPDLYATNAPLHSVARGDDYGRVDGLGVPFKVSTLQRLALGEARVHGIVHKYKTGGVRLDAQTLVFEHEPLDLPSLRDGFGDVAIEAAFRDCRVNFVGPGGRQTKLERSALAIDDMRWEPLEIYNCLTLRAALHGDVQAPSYDRVVALLAKHSVSQS